MCFRFTKTLWPGVSPGPPPDGRTPGPWGAERRTGSPDGARGPHGHRQPFSRPECASTPFPWLDHPPRGCRVPRSGNPKSGVLLPLMGSSSCVTGDPTASDSAGPPPKRPEMAVSAVFRAAGGTGLGCLPPVGQRPIHGRILKPAPVRVKLPAGRRGSRRQGRRARGLRSARRPRDGFREVEHLPGRRSCGGPETPGSEGAEPPASLRRGRTECGPTEYAGLSPITWMRPSRWSRRKRPSGHRPEQSITPRGPPSSLRKPTLKLRANQLRLRQTSSPVTVPSPQSSQSKQSQTDPSLRLSCVIVP